MASIKIKFRPSSDYGQEGMIYFQITNIKKTRLLKSGYTVFPFEWDPENSSIKTGSNPTRTDYLLAVRNGIRQDTDRLIRILEEKEAYDPGVSPDEIIEAFKTYKNRYSLVNFTESVIISLKKKGKIRTSETYQSALNSFRRYLSTRPDLVVGFNQDDIMLDCISSDIIESYAAWLENAGLVRNSRSFYCRILRAIYNRAVEEEAIDDLHPFRRVYTGVDKTIKRAIPLDAIRKIKNLNLSSFPSLDMARDIFMMSFYLRGMSFIDMAYLRKSDLKNGYVLYRRRKTGQQLIIKWTKEMQTIVDKYSQNTGRFLLPIIRDQDADSRSAYRNFGYNINHNLKRIASMAGIAIPLTLYVARHSWASVARAKGIPMSVISEGMGHDSEATTRIYIASLDTAAVDRANSLILRALR